VGEGIMWETRDKNILYHGSQKKFSEFNPKKVGSGDGKDVMGWGLYLTDSFELAKYYALNKYVYTVRVPYIDKYIQWEEEISYDLHSNIVKYLSEIPGKKRHAKELQREYEEYGNTITLHQMYDYLEAVLGNKKKVSVFL
jgi:hypothetical protein